MRQLITVLIIIRVGATGADRRALTDVAGEVCAGDDFHGGSCDANSDVVLVLQVCTSANRNVLQVAIAVACSS